MADVQVETLLLINQYIKIFFTALNKKQQALSEASRADSATVARIKHRADPDTRGRFSALTDNGKYKERIEVAGGLALEP